MPVHTSQYLNRSDVLVTIASARKKRKNLGLHQLEVWDGEKGGQVLVSFSGVAAEQEQHTGDVQNQPILSTTGKQCGKLNREEKKRIIRLLLYE